MTDRRLPADRRTLAVAAAAIAAAIIAALLASQCGPSAEDRAAEVAVAYVEATRQRQWGEEWDLLAPAARLDRNRQEWIAHGREFFAEDPPPGPIHNLRALRTSTGQNAAGEPTAEVLIAFEVPDGRTLYDLVFLVELDQGWRVTDTDDDQAREMARQLGFES